MLHLSPINLAQAGDIITLFEKVFTEAESEQEGKLIGRLVDQLIHHTEASDRFGFTASKNNIVIGSVFFSRLKVNTHKQTFLLSPVAIATEHHKQGVGQALIHYSIEQLKTKGVDWLVTYGDPQFYAKTGFQALSETLIQAPFHLSQPIGWLGQSIGEEPITKVDGRAVCVAAFNDANLW